MRGAAALAVVIAHTWPLAATGTGFEFVNQLRVAVEVFFALSGFLLFRPYVAASASGRPAPRLRDYAQRRALRILPGYWFALTACALIFGSEIVRDGFSSHWWVFYGLGQTYSSHYRFEGLATAWSLSVEASFYVLLPLLAAVVRRLGNAIGWRRSVAASLAVLFVIGLVVRWLDVSVHDPSTASVVDALMYGLPGQIVFFVIGMALAAASVELEVAGRLPSLLAWLARHTVVAWSLAAVLFAFGATLGAFVSPIGGLGYRTRWMVDDVLEAVFVGLVMVPAAFPSPRLQLPRRMLGWRPLAFLGVVSYGVYLWHWPIAVWLSVHGLVRHVVGWGLAGWPFIFLLVFGPAVVIGTASYYVVELPFLKRKRGWRGTRGKSVTSPSYPPRSRL